MNTNTRIFAGRSFNIDVPATIVYEDTKWVLTACALREDDSSEMLFWLSQKSYEGTTIGQVQFVGWHDKEDDSWALGNRVWYSIEPVSDDRAEHLRSLWVNDVDSDILNETLAKFQALGYCQTAEEVAQEAAKAREAALPHIPAIFASATVVAGRPAVLGASRGTYTIDGEQVRIYALKDTDLVTFLVKKVDSTVEVRQLMASNDTIDVLYHASH